MNAEKPIARHEPPQLLPKFLGKKVTIRLLSGGQPVTGIIKAHKPLRDPSSDGKNRDDNTQTSHRRH